MKMGITGLPGSGKTTVFAALTRGAADSGNKAEDRIGTVRVPDERVDALSRMYQPKKTTCAQVEYFLPGKSQREKVKTQGALTAIRDCDALIHVIRNFSGYGMEKPGPLSDFKAFDQELVLSDLVVVEKRRERLELDRKRGKNPDPDELALLEQCQASLEKGEPLRKHPDLAKAPQLRGFAFVSAKPMLVLFNNGDEDTEMPDVGNLAESETCAVIRGKLEQELAQMSEAEAVEFLSEFGIAASAMDRVIKSSYDLIGLISFLTVGDDEVKAWTIPAGATALEAAGVIHSDIQKGFIRAEVVAYADLMRAGSYAEARKQAAVRLEGKTYIIQDGDVVHFRFNVS